MVQYPLWVRSESFRCQRVARNHCTRQSLRRRAGRGHL